MQEEQPEEIKLLLEKLQYLIDIYIIKWIKILVHQLVLISRQKL